MDIKSWFAVIGNGSRPLVIAIAVLITVLYILTARKTSVALAVVIHRLKPITIVLITFFSILALTLMTWIYYHLHTLQTPAERTGFMFALLYGLLLFLLMVGGMFARYIWELFQAGKGWSDADLKGLLIPLVVSLMVYYPLWTIASGAVNFFSVVSAFQNGFFWQTIFSGLRPPGPPTGGGGAQPQIPGT